MAWLTENWFSVLIGIAFVAMHLFGHGGHGGHGGGKRPRNTDAEGTDDIVSRGAGPPASGHQH